MPVKQKKRVVIILQARMGASRFPGKPLKKVLDRPLLSYQVERLRRCRFVDEIVVATTINQEDAQIVNCCDLENIPCFRGSEQDVLDRYYQAATFYHSDCIVRITGDCPLIDPEIVDQVVECYLDFFPKYDYISNVLERTFPRGLDVEVFSYALLEKAAKEAKNQQDREHVTSFFYTNPKRFSLGMVKQKMDQSFHRWTVDTSEDFELITRILTTLYPKNPLFKTKDILKALDKNPEWMKLNADIHQKPLNLY